MTRCHIVIAAWLVLAAGMGTAGPNAQADRKPNILLIVGDDMGYADIGVQGATDIRTPHLDALAQHGTRFSSGYVTGSYAQPVIQMDLHATALAAAGIHDQQAFKLDGVNLVPYLKDQKKGPPHEALY